eukprot:GHVR01128701.1.p1 GENE.GHVR01128701.1~~GHVR01128701.1.p1  ORF type:complete len:105 (-),score=24.14 GHVR01128701.1:1214-1528(-)
MLHYEIENRISVLSLALAINYKSEEEKTKGKRNIRVESKLPNRIQNKSNFNSYDLPPLVENNNNIITPVNNITVPVPNYLYSRIGPNNQGLLSPTTLQNKLRVI